METRTIINDRYPDNKKRLLLNLITSIWFEKEKERILALGDEDRSKLWNKMDPYNMIVEPSELFKDGNIISCLIDRKAGVLLPDRKIPCIAFKDFLEKGFKSDKINSEGDYSDFLPNAINNGISTWDLYDAISSPDENLSGDPIFYICEPVEIVPVGDKSDTDSNGIVILYDSKNKDAEIDDLISWIFKDYDFERIEFNRKDKTDNVQKPDKSNLSSFFTGTVVVSDKVLKEKTLTINFIDLYFLSNVIDDGTLAKITTLAMTNFRITSDGKTYTGDLPASISLNVDLKNTISPEDLKLTTFLDALGDNITDKVGCEFIEIDDEKSAFYGSLNIKDYDWPLFFNENDGEEIKVGFSLNGVEKSTTTKYLTQYKDDSITPKIESIVKTDAGWDISLSFLNSLGKRITKAVQQNLADDYQLFDETGTNPAKYNGGGVRFVNNTSENTNPAIGTISTTIDQFGDFTLKFSDSGFKEVSGYLINPNGEYEFRFLSSEAVKDDYEKVLKFELYKNGVKQTYEKMPIEIDKLQITCDDDTPSFYAYMVDNTLSIFISNDKSDIPEKINVSGYVNIGTNLANVDISWEGNVPESAPVE